MGEKLVFRPVVVWSKSLDLGGFVEQIAPSALERTFREGIDVRALVAHDPLRPIGRLSAGTLTLKTDSRGLLAEVDLPDTSYAHDAQEQIRRGDARGSSYAFSTIEDAWVMDGDVPLRTVTDMLIREVSAAVCWPAYVLTETASRYAPIAHVEESGPAGVSDREFACSFAPRVRRLLDGCHTLEIRCNYLTGEKTVHRRSRNTNARWPSVRMRRRQLEVEAIEEELANA